MHSGLYYLIGAERPVVEDVPPLHLVVSVHAGHLVQVGQHAQLAAGEHVVVRVCGGGALLVLLVGVVAGANIWSVESIASSLYIFGGSNLIQSIQGTKRVFRLLLN